MRKSWTLLLFMLVVLCSGTVAADSGLDNLDYDLSGDNVSGREHVTSFHYQANIEYKPVDTSLVIDESGSMGGVMEDAKNGAKDYVDNTRTSDGDMNAVVEFASGASTIQSLTSSKSAAKDAIDTISAGGGTDHSAAVSEGHDSLKSSSKQNKVMIVLGDGCGGSASSEADAARSDGIEIHAMMYGSGACTGDFESMLTGETCSTSSSENDDGDNCWYAEPGTVDTVYHAIREETQSQRNADFYAIMPSHAHSFERNPDNVLGDGRKEYIFNDVTVNDGSYTLDFPWHPTTHGNDLSMKTGDSYIEFTEDGSTDTYYFSQTESRDIKYVDLNVTDYHAIRKEDEIDVSATVKNEGNAESREVPFSIYDESGNSIDETLPRLSPGETETYSYTLSEPHDVFDDAEMIKVKADVSGIWGSDGKELEPNEDNNVRKMGYPVKPIKPEDFDPDNAEYGDNLVEELGLGHPEPSAIYGYYDLWVGYNGYKPSDGDPELRHDNRSYDSTGSFTYTQAEEVDRAETYWNFTNRVNDTYGSMSVFNYSLFVDNPPPVITDHNPEDDGFTSEYPIPVSVTARDANDDDFTVYVFNHTDNYLLTKETTSDYDPAEYDWSVPEAYSDYEMRITVEDRWENTTKNVNFLKIIGQGFAMESSFNNKYSSMIISNSSTGNVLFELENTRSFERDINLTLSGVEAVFEDGRKTYKEIVLGPDESRELLLIVSPEDSGQRYLNVTMNHTEIMYSKTESYPVYVRDIPATTSQREVPGIGGIHLVVIMLLSVLLYYPRL